MVATTIASPAGYRSPLKHNNILFPAAVFSVRNDPVHFLAAGLQCAAFVLCFHHVQVLLHLLGALLLIAHGFLPEVWQALEIFGLLVQVFVHFL